MLELKELKDLHDKAYKHNQVTRERAADDLVFYWVSQWDDNLLGESSLQYRGEFNVLRKAGRKIIADLRANPIQVDFSPVDEDRDDGADLIDGLYRKDDLSNTSIEAYDNASAESVVCGVGDWELFTDYKSNRAGNKNQVIKRRPIHEANNNSFPDPNAKLLDKSDAKHWSILTAYSEDGYKDLVKELTGDEISGAVMDSFSNPEDSFSFPWIQGKNSLVYVVSFYHREQVKDKVITFSDPFGQELLLRESDLTDYMEELLEGGYKITDEQIIKRWQVTKYIASGERVLDSYAIAGEHIPVIRTYGERAFIEGEEHYEGVTRLAKDPQRLRNFQMSYLADIVSRSPRPKPIFNPEQIQGYEFMYEENGVENNYPYLLQNSKTPDGNPLPIGPVAQLPEQNVPVALVQSIQLSREAVADVAPANVPQDIADIDLSGKAVAGLQARLDEQSIVYQQNLKHAKRRDAEIYASMASDVYDAPRQESITLPDGSRKKVLNDLTNMEFEVFAEIGPSYSTKKEQTFDQLGAMIEKSAVIDPGMARLYLLKQSQLIDGVDMKDVRDYSRKQLLLGGYVEPDPENEEDMKIMQQAQQNQQPDANMVLAMAEQGKADANMAEVQRKAQVDQFNAMTDAQKIEVQQFDAQTKRMAVQVDAEEADANINMKRMDMMTKRIDAVNNQSFRARVN